MAKKVLRYVFLYLGLFLLSATGVFLFRYYKAVHKSQKSFEEVKNLIVTPKEELPEVTAPPRVSVSPSPTSVVANTPTPTPEVTPIPPEVAQREKYAQLLETNKNFVGWLTVPNTKIDYPVVQTKDDEQYYLNRNFYGQKDGAGTLFCNAASDLDIPSDIIVIHGHHMQAGTMMQNISFYKKKDFYEENPTFRFDTIYRTGTYEIVAAVITDVNPGSFDYNSLGNVTEEEFNEFIEFAKSHSAYEIETLNDVQYGDKLVILSTCAYHVRNGRFIVVGRLISSNDPTVFE